MPAMQHSHQETAACAQEQQQQCNSVSEDHRTTAAVYAPGSSYCGVACFDSPAVLDGKSGSSRCWHIPAMGTETQRWHHIQGQRSSHGGRGHPHRGHLCGKAVLVCLLRCTFWSPLLLIVRKSGVPFSTLRTEAGDIR